MVDVVYVAKEIPNSPKEAERLFLTMQLSGFSLVCRRDDGVAIFEKVLQ